MDKAGMGKIIAEIDAEGDWDRRVENKRDQLLPLSPWGFCWIKETADLERIIPEPEITLKFE